MTSFLFHSRQSFLNSEKKLSFAVGNFRHFFNTANEVGFPLSSMEQILYEMGSMTEAVITQVAAELPTDFPSFITDPIFEGMRRYSQRLLS